MRVGFFLLICSGMIGCSDGVVDPELNGELSTTQSSYTFTPISATNFVVSVVVRFRNRSPQTVYIRRCDDDHPSPRFTVHDASNAAIDPALTPASACPGGVAGFSVQPNQEHEYTLLIAHQSQAGTPEFISGDYIIGFELRDTPLPPDGDFTPAERIFSNPFRVNAP